MEKLVALFVCVLGGLAALVVAVVATPLSWAVELWWLGPVILSIAGTVLHAGKK